MADLPRCVDDIVVPELAELQEQWKASLPATLEELRDQWERSGCTDVPTLVCALNMIGGILPPPPWLVSGLNKVLEQLRPSQWKKDEKRWLLVQHLHYDRGLTWEKAYQAAAKELGGKPDTMRKSYQAYDNSLPPDQRAHARSRPWSAPHPECINVVEGWAYARVTDLSWLMNRCRDLIEVKRYDGFARLKSTTDILQLLRHCPGLVEDGCCGPVVRFKRRRLAGSEVIGAGADPPA
jgi:hypothetical protein